MGIGASLERGPWGVKRLDGPPRGSCRIQGLRRETDFPHTTSTYPKSKETREAALADVPEAERRKILVENAVKLFKLDAA